MADRLTIEEWGALLDELRIAEIAAARDKTVDATFFGLSAVQKLDIKNFVSLAMGHESLDRSPKKNWVERAGQLPAFIQHIAKDLHEERGMPLSRAIATAISVCKRWASGVGNVKPDTRAKAAKAIAEWEALKAKNKARQLKK